MASTPRFILILSSLAVVPQIAVAQGPWPAPESQPAPPLAARSPDNVAAVPDENFESFTLGSLGGQGAWWNPSNNSRDEVIANGINGRSGRVLVDGATTPTSGAARSFEPGFGILSFDLRVPPLDTGLLLGPYSEPNATTTLLDPQALITIGGDRQVSLFQRTSATVGEYVRLDQQLAENTTARFSWDLRADGSVRLYRDGRLITIGQSESVAISGTPRQLGAVFFGSFNNVTPSTDGSRNAMVFDNFSGALPARNDLPDETDLTLVASYGRINPGQALRGTREIAVNSGYDVTLIAVNSGPAVATGTHIGGILPSGYRMIGIDCPITQTGDNWDTQPVTVNAGALLTCHARLVLPAGVSSSAGWIVPMVVNADTPDPFADNNLKSLVVQAGLFADGLE